MKTSHHKKIKVANIPHHRVIDNGREYLSTYVDRLSPVLKGMIERKLFKKYRFSSHSPRPDNLL